jgi:rubrerythrin
MDNFRSTALYSVVRSLDDNLRQDIFRSWTEVVTVPTLELLASRWEEVDQRTLEALQADYQAESETLERYTQSAVFDRVMHLADEDARQSM